MIYFEAKLRLYVSDSILQSTARTKGEWWGRRLECTIMYLRLVC
jgi:hypothetical protein